MSDTDQLRALVNDTTATETEREQALTELVNRYLQDTTLTHGLDSALAVLAATNRPSFQNWYDQLLVRAGQYGSSSRPLLTGTGPRWASARSTDAVSGAVHRTGSITYATRVLDLLAPLGSDSAITIAIATNAALYAELLAMAQDSLTWGNQVARGALNRYAGANYREWYADFAPAGDSVAARAAQPAGARKPLRAAGQLALVPNPTTGPVQVQYVLPKGTRAAELVVYDSWSQEVGRYALHIEAASVELTLRQRLGLYHCQLRADGIVIDRQRLLLTH